MESGKTELEVLTAEELEMYRYPCMKRKDECGFVLKDCPFCKNGYDVVMRAYRTPRVDGGLSFWVECRCGTYAASDT